MRIIAGKLKGRTVIVPKSKLVRPTTDRNREAIFNYLNNIFNFEDAVVLDLYAGTGALGLEAISRGAASVTFVEKNFKIYKNLLNNIKTLGVEGYAKVVKSEATKFTRDSSEKFHLILADPPFFHYDVYEVFENIFNNDLLEDNGLLIIERSIQTKEKDVNAFGAEPVRRLGDSLIYEFSKEGN
jgi:16S rRNA (guanine966-N2)-methyltransferase